MERFQYLMRKRARALGAFTRAMKDLENINKDIEEEAVRSRQSISSHEAEIERRSSAIAAEKRAITYLTEEAKVNAETMKKIQAIVA